MEPTHDRKPAPSTGVPSPTAGGSPPLDEDGFTDTTEEWVRDGRAEIITGAPHPGRLPTPPQPTDPGTGNSEKPTRAPGEQRLIDDLARLEGRPLTEQEANLAIDQAQSLGDLDRPPRTGTTDLRRLATLLRQHNTITDEIARLIGRPAERGHVGEYIASRIFRIRLAETATERGIDGIFAEGPLEGRTVNVRWQGRREEMLDLDTSERTEFYLVLVGAKRPATTSKGTSRPWTIQAVHLFDARRLHTALRGRGVAIGEASSVAGQFWTESEVYPKLRNAALVLSQEQRDLLALFG